MSKLRLFADPLSTPCKAVMIFLAANNVPYELVKISLKDDEQFKNPEFLAISPNNKIPVIEDNGYTLFESIAILRYIQNKYNLHDHWYPKDVYKRGQVDEALAWFPGNLRCSAFFFTALRPAKTGQPTPEALLEDAQTTLKRSVDTVENYFLKTTKFVAGDEITIADLMFSTEVDRYKIMGIDLCEGRPRMTQWLGNVRGYFSPHYDEVNEDARKLMEAKTLFTEMKYF